MVTVRPVRDGDGEHLVAAWNDVRGYYASLDAAYFRPPDPDHAVDVERFVASLRRAEDDPARFSAVGEVERRPVGFITAHVVGPADDPDAEMIRDLEGTRGHIDALVVHRSGWRRGVGRALVTEAERWAGTRGAVVLLLDTYHQSPVSLPFYEALGYGRQAIVFRKSLRGLT